MARSEYWISAVSPETSDSEMRPFNAKHRAIKEMTAGKNRT